MLRILLDNGIRTHSEFLEPAVKETQIQWANTKQVSSVHGLTRKSPHKDVEYQKQIDAVFTVGRLIREGAVVAYTYWEIECERFRDMIGLRACNALKGCTIHNCPSAIQRSKFRRSIDLKDVISKGGKKDRKARASLGGTNQLTFFEWLNALTPTTIQLLLDNAAIIGLTEFEIQTFKNIDWFQSLCRRSGSSENYPDIFHLWTAERNGLDAFLTLESRFCNFISNVKNEKAKTIKIDAEVLRPFELLRKLGITKPDPIPLELGRFYPLHEMPD